jgi:LuxR family transcriptional regulator, maltose regulon positive regulatory protein
MTMSVSGAVRSAAERRSGLLDDKLRVPALGLAVVSRHRVEQLMDQASRHPVTVVTGPAGAGKTVACATWASALASRPGARLVWLTLDAADGEPARFWRYLITGLARAGALASSAEAELGGRPALAGGGAAAAEGIAQRLLGCLAATDEPTTVVLDDVHLLAGSPALAGLDELIHHAPPGLRLVLAGRYAPGLALAKLRLAGQVGDLGAADLACTSQEADDYLAAAGLTPGPAERAAIMRQTEGWMAGLRMLSMTAPQADGKLLNGDAAELVTDYLCDEVLAPLPEATQRLLLRTCLTDTVPADLAQSLTDDSAAAATIDQLSRENALIGTVAADRAEYRYHPMLRCMLLTVLRREHACELPDLLGTVARWHAERAEVAAAIRAAGQAGDWEFGLQVLREAGPVVPAPAEWAELEEALAAFPPALRSNDAALACALAAARLWQGDPDGALPHLDCAQAAVTALTGVQRATTELWLAALQVMRLAGSADLAAEWAQASRAHQESRSVPEHRAVGLLWLALGCSQLRRLHLQTARIALQHASSQLAAGGLTWPRERGRCWEAVAHACYGDLSTATRVGAEVAEGPARRIDGLAPILAVSQAVVHIARDEPEAAATVLDHAEQVLASPQPVGEPALALLIGLARTRIAIDEGNLTAARGLVRPLTEVAVGDQPARIAVSRLDAEISLAAGERERARSLLAAVSPGAAGSWPEIAVGQARVLMADGDDKGALRLLEPVLVNPTAAPDAPSLADAATGPDAGGPGSGVAESPDAAGPAGPADAAGLLPAAARPATLACRLSALLTAVLAHRRLNQAAEAAERLEEALALAEPDDQPGQFIAAGSPIRSALTVLITPASPRAAFAARILERFDGRLAHRSGEPTGAPLTEAELAVLRFLPSHMTNQEIAESLFLSINTIKTHLSSVYRKLGVTSRRQAIAQGRRLDLLLCLPAGWMVRAAHAVARTLRGGCGPLLWPSAGRPPPKAPLARLAEPGRR